MADSFAGIPQAYRRVKDAAVDYGWTIAAESTASTDSRYLEIVRGSESLKIRVSHHISLSECDISVDPSNPSMTEAIDALTAMPKFWKTDEANAWLSAMRGRAHWKQSVISREKGDVHFADDLQALAEEARDAHPYLVSGGRRKILPIDVEWFARVEMNFEP